MPVTGGYLHADGARGRRGDAICAFGHHAPVVSWFLRIGTAGQGRDAQAKLVAHHRQAVPPGAARCHWKAAVDGAVAGQPSVNTFWWPPGIDIGWTGAATTLVARTVGSASPAHPRGLPTPSSRSFCSTSRDHPVKPKGIMHPRRLPDPGVYTPQLHVFDIKAGIRRLVVLADIGWVTDHQLHRLRPAVQQRHPGGVRGHAGLPRRAPAFPGHQKVAASQIYYRAHPSSGPSWR